MARIIISRKKEWTNRARKFGVFIDGEKKDTISNGEIKDIEVTPGKHKLIFKVDWCSSPELEFEAKEEKSKTVEVSGFKANKWLLILSYIILGVYFFSVFILQKDMKAIMYFIIPIFLVYLYYLTLGRKKYLEINEL
jgi:hypothetical protein